MSAAPASSAPPAPGTTPGQTQAHTPAAAPAPAPPPPPKPAPPAEPFTIPHDSPYRSIWDGVLFFMLLFTVITVPLRIGFQLTDWRPWIGPDIIVDVIFVLDIISHFLMTFEQDGELVKDRAQIRWRYLKGWFVADMLSAIPLEFFLGPSIGEYNPAMRSNRMIRMGRLVYFFMIWEKASSLKPSIIKIFKSMFVVVFYTHFMGCVFYLLVLIEGDAANPRFGNDWTGTINLTKRTFIIRYLRSFYWSFITLTGYNNTMPNTNLEAAFSTIMTVSGIIMVSTIIGTVGSLVTNLDSSKLYFRQKLDGINDYMRYKKLPTDLQDDVRSYYSYLWKSGKGLDKTQVLDDLPTNLQHKLNVFMNSEIVRKVSLFQQAKDDENFITEVVKCLTPRVCLPNSFVVRKGEMGTEMYFISRGELNVVNDEDKVVFTLKDGGFFGEIALLYDTKRTASIVARTYCDMFILTKEDFKKVLKKFPDQSKGIKEIAKERFQGIVDAEKKKEEEARAAKAAAEAAAAVTALQARAEDHLRVESEDDKSERAHTAPPTPNAASTPATKPQE